MVSVSAVSHSTGETWDRKVSEIVDFFSIINLIIHIVFVILVNRGLWSASVPKKYTNFVLIFILS